MKQVFICKLLIFCVVFGFYLGPLRSDQILILIFGILALLKLFKSGQLITTREILLLLLLIFFIVIGILSFLFNENLVFTSLFVAQLENYVSLIAIYLIWLFYFKNKSLNQLMEIQKTFIFAMCLVTTLTLLAKTFGYEVLSIFHKAKVGQHTNPDVIGMTLLQLTQSSGRNPGTFGQIFEAGTAYFLAFLSVLSIREFYSNRLSWIASVFFVVLGGLLVGSKIFIFGTFVLILLYAFQFSKILFSFLVTVQFSSIAVLIKYDVGLPWQFRRLIQNITLENIFHVYTSARFADGSAIVSGMKKIFEESPIVGMGFGYLDTSDFSLYEVISISGMIGVVIYIFIILFMYFDSGSKLDAARTLLVILFILTISISAPAISANKIGFLLLICLLSLKRIWRENK